MSYEPSAFLTGEIRSYAGTTAPNGWLLCFGQAISRTTYASLFSILSTSFGVGDGSTTFNVPDLRGRLAVGKDNMGGSAASRVTSGNSGITGTTLGASGGLETLMSHTHGATGLSNSTSSVSGSVGGSDGTHSHGLIDSNSNALAVYALANPANGGAPFVCPADMNSLHTPQRNTSTNTTGSGHGHSFSLTSAAQSISGSTASTGTGASHGNMPPSLILNTIIKF